MYTDIADKSYIFQETSQTPAFGGCATGLIMYTHVHLLSKTKNRNIIYTFTYIINRYR